MMNRSALVVGASGLVGGHCLELLLTDDAYTEVVSLGRRRLTREHAKLKQHVVEFDNLGASKHLAKAQDVFCCLGTTIKQAGTKEAFYKVDFTYAFEVARIASENGAEQFLIVSSLGADPRSSVFYSRVKGETEAAVSRLPFQAVHIFRPSLLIGERAEVRMGEQIAEKASRLLSFAFVGRLSKYRPIEARTVAAAMIRTAKEGRRGVHIIESDRIARIANDE
ncbi:MAG TPA: oxidoreductase [Pyrinomonadaceae bacterium]|jgi:uncharacterized protein YbjT (DUF2867 family)